MDKRKTNARILKHQVLNNVEYATIKRRGKVLLEIPGDDIGKKINWRDFQIYVGKKIGAGRFSFTIKFKNSGELYTGQTNAVDPDIDIAKSNESDSILEKVTTVFKSLESKLNNATQSGGVTYEMLLTSTKQGYDITVDFLKQQLTFKDGTISELKIEIRDLNSELDTADVTIRQLEQRTGYNQYLEPISKILFAKFGGGTPVKLEDSDPSGIPPEILQVLGVIDYSKIKPEDLQKMVQLLQQYISATSLPLKGQ